MDVLMGAIELGVEYVSRTRSHGELAQAPERGRVPDELQRDAIHRRREERAAAGVATAGRGEGRAVASVIRELENAEQSVMRIPSSRRSSAATTAAAPEPGRHGRDRL